MDINYNALFELDSDSGDAGVNTPLAAECRKIRKTTN